MGRSRGHRRKVRGVMAECGDVYVDGLIINLVGSREAVVWINLILHDVDVGV